MFQCNKGPNGTHYVYKMYDVTEDNYYGGVRTCPLGVAPEDDDYMGSSKIVKEKIEAGNEFVKIIIAVYSTRQEANKAERRYLEKHEAAQSENWYNQTNGYPIPMADRNGLTTQGWPDWISSGSFSKKGIYISRPLPGQPSIEELEKKLVKRIKENLRWVDPFLKKK